MPDKDKEINNQTAKFIKSIVGKTVVDVDIFRHCGSAQLIFDDGTALHINEPSRCGSFYFDFSEIKNRLETIKGENKGIKWKISMGGLSYSSGVTQIEFSICNITPQAENYWMSSRSTVTIDCDRNGELKFPYLKEKFLETIISKAVAKVIDSFSFGKIKWKFLK